MKASTQLWIFVAGFLLVCATALCCHGQALAAITVPPLPPASPATTNRPSDAPLPSTKTISLAWNYPSNSLSADLSFVLVATNQLGPLPWMPIANPMASNCIVTNSFDGAQFTFSTPIQMTPGAMYFAVCASNLWGLSTTSNVATTPPAPIQVTALRITKTNQ